MIVITRTDGGVSLMTLGENADANEEIKKWQAAHPDMYVKHIEYDGEMPDAREYRDALTMDKGGLTFDMTKAKDIFRQGLREQRKSKLELLDLEMMKSLELPTKQANEEKQKIMQKKTLLRDVTALPEIEDAETVEQLRSIRPACLE